MTIPRIPIKSILVLFLVLLCLPILSLAGQFKVTRVPDGDTITAVGHDIEIKVRLVGIDAPEVSHRKREPGQPYSDKAQKYLASLVLNKTVEVKGYGSDRYGRLLAVVSLNGKNINLEMIEAGLAEVYRGAPARGLDMSLYWKAEEQAKHVRRGMWSLGDKYISPRQWRHADRNRPN